MTKKEHFPRPPEYVLHEFSFKSHEKQSNGKTWKKGILHALETSTLQNEPLKTGRVFHGGAVWMF